MHSMTQQKGFTLIETLVAITIILTAIAGPLTIASQGLRAARISRDRIVAIYLAQEAIEYIRTVRDSNVLRDETNWLEGLDACMGQNCTIDVPAGNVAICDGGDCDALHYDDNIGLYGYTSGDDSIYTRSIRINELVSGREAALNVRVTWRDGLANRDVTVNENIFNWQ